MSLKVLEECLGCGACEIPCEPGAITQGTDFQIAYVVDPLLCNDCGECIPVCPVEALVEDGEWAVCMARGCPLTASRLAGWECTQGRGDQGGVCPQCHAFLWRPVGEDDDAWRCPRCDDHMKVICPKVRKSEAVTA